jgi:hypothetical protein
MPVDIVELGDLPSDLSSITLKRDKTYTFTIRIPRTILEVKESTVRDEIKKSGFGRSWIEVIDVKNPTLTDDYLIAFKLRVRQTTLSKLIQMFMFNFKDKWKDVSVVDFKSGVKLETKGLIPSFPSPTKILGNIKWIAIAGFGIMALRYIGPIIKKVSTFIPVKKES